MVHKATLHKVKGFVLWVIFRANPVQLSGADAVAVQPQGKRTNVLVS